MMLAGKFENSFARSVRAVDVQRPELTNFIMWLKAAMEAKHIPSIRELARRAGISASGLASNLRGETSPTRETVHKLAVFFQVDETTLLALLVAPNYTKRLPDSTLLDDATGVVLVPVLEQTAGAGEGRALLDYEYVSPTITGRHNVVAIRIKGNCMAPRIEDGDTVIVDRERDWQDGRVVLARIDDSLVVKRAYRQDGLVRLRPDNPKFEEAVTTEEYIMGVVIRVIKPI